MHNAVAVSSYTKAYYTYRIFVFNYDRVQVQKWDDKHQSLGESLGVFRYQDKLTEIAPLLTTVRDNELNNPRNTRALGEALFDILFDDRLLQDFVNFYYRIVQQDKQLLRVELDIDEQGMPEIAALPWEFMCVPTRADLGTIWLATVPDLVFSRRRAQWIPAAPIQLDKDEKLRIALAISAPSDLSPVAYEPVQKALENLALELGNRVELLPIVKSANPETVDEVLAKEPHILHFIGHGRLANENSQEIGQIAFVDPEFDEAMWVDADYFSELFNQHRPGVVMLQACEGGMLSASQAFVGVASRVVQQNIPVVVAMQYEVTNSTASRFSRRFYQQLVQGDPVDIAAQYGRREIALGPTQYRKRDFATPVIFMRVLNGYLFSHQEVADANAQKKPKAKRPSNEEKLLLELVKTEVITRLNQSLHNAVPINLGKEAQPEQVKLPWSPDIKIGDKPSEPIPDDRTILEIFDQEEIAGKLLILGNPGAGKTTTMLDLAKALIARAEQEADYPIPVLFNLSNWNDDKQSMSDWLVAELKSKYWIPKDIGAKWVSAANLLPMLDGLDELEPGSQQPCVRKINEFFSDCHPQYLVVCSRREEYEKVVRGQWQQDGQQESEETSKPQDKRLHLNNAIVLKPLRDEQIQTYLEGLNEIELWNIVQLNVELLELVRSPLFLSIVKFISTHETFSIQEFKKKTSTKKQHQYLFEAYCKAARKRDIVTRKMDLRGWSSLSYKKKKTPSWEETQKWLVYLAQQLKREPKSNTEFLIEKINPSWLPNKCQKQIYAVGLGLFFGLIAGLITGTIIFVFFGNFIDIFVARFLGLFFGIFVALWSGIWAVLTIGQSPDIEPVDTLNISWLRLGKSLTIGLLIAIISWPITTILLIILNSQINLQTQLIFLIIIAPLLVIILEMKGAQLNIIREPNQGILQSFKNAIFFALLGSVWLGLSAYIMRDKIFFVSLVFNKSAVPGDQVLSLRHTVVIVLSGMLAGTFFGLTQAGIACIQHFTLRLILYGNGYIPWNYAQFLDYCTERLFLQRVGGRYRFIHQLMQDHFAAMPLKK